MSDELEHIFEGDLVFNGVNGATGSYGLAPMSSADLAAIVKGKAAPQPQNVEELKDRQRRDTIKSSPVKEGVDPTRLDQAGWAVIFPAAGDPKKTEGVKAALAELLTLRQSQAGELFKIYEGANGYRPGETRDQFFKRQRPEIKRGPADPAQMPFYVLIAGSPEDIPYEFQYQLDVMRGVGRIDFGDDLDAWARYAHNVAAAEAGQARLARQIAFFAPANPGDKATQLSAQYLVKPLVENLQIQQPKGEIGLKSAWPIQTFAAEQATKAQLRGLLSGGQAPAVLFTASHGMEFPPGDPRQMPHQGALLCQDWPGPNSWGGDPIPQDFYFAGDDLGQNVNVLGLIAFFFACYGAGTPRLDQFAKQAFKDKREEIAPRSLVGALPKSLLERGALAVLGHVERAWGYSFLSPAGGVDNQAFVTALRKLLNGDPVGLATDPSFNARYADIASELSAYLENLEYEPEAKNDYEVAQMWTANNDARAYVVIGDPAARLVLAPADARPSGQGG